MGLDSEFRFPHGDHVTHSFEFFQFVLVLTRRGFGNLAVFLGMDDEDRARKLGTDFFEVRTDFVTVLSVIDHDEQHSFLAEPLEAKELRLRDISTIEQANAFAPRFAADCNRALRALGPEPP